MKALQENWYYYLWITGISIAAVAVVFFTYSFFSNFSESTEKAMRSGQRVVVDVETMEAVFTPIGGELKNADGDKDLYTNVVQNDGKIVHDGKIAIMVKNVGMMKENTQKAMELPEIIGLSISPYSITFTQTMEKLKTANRDILLDFPMAAADFPDSDPGNLGMLFSVDNEQNIERFQKLMAKRDGIIGLVAPEKEAFTHVPEHFSGIMDELKKSSLTFIYNSQPENDYLQNGLKTNNVPFHSQPVYIDAVLAPEVISKNLANIRKRLNAGEKGILVVIRPFPISMNMVQSWVKKLERNGIFLSPVSMVLAETVKKNLKKEGDKKKNG